MQTLRTLFLALLILLPLSANAEWLAVLEINDLELKPQVLVQISDGLREGALDTIRSADADIKMMTRENMLVRLSDMGIDPSCVEGECEVETARNIGADYVISATLLELEGVWILSAKLHESEEGELLATDRIRSASLLALIDATPAVAGSLLAQGLSLYASSSSTVPPVYSAPKTSSSSGDFSIGDLGVEGLLAEQECTRAAEVRAPSERKERMLNEVLRLKGVASRTWINLKPQLSSCARLDDSGRRKICAVKLSEFYSWVTGFQVSENAGAVEITMACGRRSVALESSSVVSVDLESLLSETEEMLRALKVSGVRLKKSIPGASSQGDLATVDLGVTRLLTEQGCRRDAEQTAHERSSGRIQTAVTAEAASAKATWLKLAPQLEAAAKLEESSQRTPFINKTREFINWASQLEVSESAGVESVETSCGVLKVAIPGSREVVDVSAFVKSAERLVQVLERPDRVILEPGGVNSGSMSLVAIPASKYEMGCTSGQGDRSRDRSFSGGRVASMCSSDEKPAHSVKMTRSFNIMTTEVTQGQYRAVTGNNPSYFTDCGDDCPVERVSWYDAVKYANVLSALEGLSVCYRINGDDVKRINGLDCEGYRLPTEAEWEVAARGGADTRYAGSDDIDSVSWHANNSDATTHPVGQKNANGYGLYDMSGNVWEWTWDWYDFKYYKKSGWKDPQGPLNGTMRTRRGGSWYFMAEDHRVSIRTRYAPNSTYRDLGFRLVRSTP